MNSTLVFAKQELNKYLNRIAGIGADNIRLLVNPVSPFWDGQVTSELDDAYHIDITAGIGTIIGSSPRSVLLGVYKFLSLLGCCFYAPGKGGEYIPSKDSTDCSAAFCGIASLRHRGICIEGAVSFENVRDMIDWLPKNGFNSYFIQFREGHTFFERWYTHEGSTCQQPEAYTVEESRRFVELIETEIQKRDLIYHKIGHGWTCECLGYPSTGWHKVDSASIPETIRPLLAEVSGKREFFEDIPLNTHLCYSNSEAQRRFVDEVIHYARKNRSVSALHIWLADNYNNTCECAACQQKTQTDWYVELLNEIDRRLTEQNLSTRIVFLIYFELLWPPVQERLLHPERFILMFAPITRTYTRPFYEISETVNRSVTGTLPEYVRNHATFPDNVKENLQYLYHWQQHFGGDSFDFDYHLMWDIDKEFGGYQLAKVLYDDCIRLREMGLNGLISCQLGRATFPTALCQYVMGRVLFDTSLPFEQLAREYFQAAYGDHSSLAQDYVRQLSEKFSHAYIRGEKEDRTASEYAAQFKETGAYIRSMTPAIHSAASAAYGTSFERMWTTLDASLPIHTLLADALAEKAGGASAERMKELAASLRDAVSQAELTIQLDLDAMYFNMLVGGFLEHTEDAQI